MCTLIRYLFFFFFFCFCFCSLFLFLVLLLSWMFESDCLNTRCFGYLICMYFVFLFLDLFSATEHISHGKAL